MDILRDLQNMMGSASGGALGGGMAGRGMGTGMGRGPSLGPGAGAGAGMEMGGLGDRLGGMLNSGAMGRIAQTILGNKNGGMSWLKGALLAGAGGMLWKQLTERMEEANKANPKYNPLSRFSNDESAPSATEEQAAARMVRALIYAAKADGHIDAKEKAAINGQIAAMNLGADAKTLVQAVMDEAIDPSRIAVGVNDPEEALKLYTLSAAVVNPDQFMEKAYLDALAQALNIPDDVRDQVIRQINHNRHSSTAGVM